MRSRLLILLEETNRREELSGWVLSVHSVLDGVTVDLDVRLLESQRISSSDEDLLLNKIDTGDLLGDGMFHLEAGVHFEEVEILVLVDQEFNGTSALVTASFSEGNSLGSHLVTGLRVEEGRGSLLDNLLVTSLHRALTLGHVNVVSMLITKDLILDVLGLLDVFLNENSAITEGGDSLITRDLEALDSFLVVEGNTHTLATTASGGLDHHGIADLVGDLEDFSVTVDLTEEPRNS